MEINVDYGGSGLFLLLEIESSESCELKKVEFFLILDIWVMICF